ncbi:MAG TPA: lasso peptide [Methylomirabilota bacterium]|jgi:hypothetical protein|nr:lasso peptide [Methylomirabilota bacterium]
MKKTYETPRLIVHGAIEEMTQALGSASANDAIIWGSFSFDPPLISGSRDLIIRRG